MTMAQVVGWWLVCAMLTFFVGLHNLTAQGVCGRRWSLLVMCLLVMCLTIWPLGLGLWALTWLDDARRRRAEDDEEDWWRR